MQINHHEKWVLLGGSRGLGAAFREVAAAQFPQLDLIVISRKMTSSGARTFDFSKSEQWDDLVNWILSERPSRVFYFAGGGPFGDYCEKEWKDHLWSYHVNFLCPAFLVHQLGRVSSSSNDCLRQMVLIGSSVAENSPDARAASYAAGKHALRGLHRSLVLEGSLGFDLRLFSPSYMETDLLPMNSVPRLQGKAAKANEVAVKLLDWIVSKNDANGHFAL